MARGLPYVLVEFGDDPTAAHVQIDDIAGATSGPRALRVLADRLERRPDARPRSA